jgi:hypothetical protein
MQKLSQETDLSIGHLSRLERSRSALTVATRGIVVRADGRRQLTFAELGNCDELFSPALPGPIEVLHSSVEPGSESGEPDRHQSGEAGFLIAASLELWIGNRHFQLKAGDSLSSIQAGPMIRWRQP